jgi:hypothetical protein
MKRSFAKLAAYMKRELTNTEVRGRGVLFNVSNAMASGMNKMMVCDDGDAMDVDNVEESEWVNLKDGIEEVDNNRSLDID